MNTSPNCRFCGKPLHHVFADLGVQPFCETYLELDQLNKMEPFYQLLVYLCNNCFLVQLNDSMSPKQLFSEYSYFSSQSKGWLQHAEKYAQMIIAKLNLNEKSQVIEIGSNDGYLLQFFARRGIPVIGVEPAANVASEATRKGIPTIVKFFNKEISQEMINQNKKADLIIGNNIIAQVPDLNDFVEGLKNLLKADGIITIEFHHLMKMIGNNQFDTISHERFSYFSFSVVEKVFATHGLTVFDVEELPTHGGSLRIYASHTENLSLPISPHVTEQRIKEDFEGLTKLEKYLSFEEKIKETKRNILSLLIDLKRNNKMVIGYGAHAEAQTFLNYCGIRSDFLDYIADRNPFKQGKFLGGSHIPILKPEGIKETRPDYILILAWNIKGDLMNQMSYISDWNGQFIVSIPQVTFFNADGTEAKRDVLQKEGK